MGKGKRRFIDSFLSFSEQTGNLFTTRGGVCYIHIYASQSIREFNLMERNVISVGGCMATTAYLLGSEPTVVN